MALVTSYAQYSIPPFNPKTYRNSLRTDKSNSSKVDTNESVKPKVKIIGRNGKFGVFDESINKTIVKLKYDKIEPFCEGYALVVKDGKMGVITSTGIEYIKSKYVEILPTPSQILTEVPNPPFRVKDKNRWFLMTNGGPVSQPYDSISASPDGVFYGETRDDEWIILNLNKTEEVSIKASRKEMTKRVLPDQNILFNGRIYNNKGILQVSGNGKVKKIELNDNEYWYSGKRIYSVNDYLDSTYYFREGNYTQDDSPDGFYKNRKYNRFFIREGKIYSVFPLGYSDLINVIQDIKTEKKGLVYDDSIILSPSFSDIYIKDVSKNKERDEIKKNYGIFKPREIITIVIDRDSDEKDLKEKTEIFARKLNSKIPKCIINLISQDKSRIWGFYDNYIDIPVPNEIVIGYDGLPCVEYEDGLALYDSQGKCMISKITTVQPLKKGIYKISKENKWGLAYFINGNIEKIVEPQFDGIEDLDKIVDGWAGKTEAVHNLIITKNGLKGLYSDSGEEILPCKFQKIEKLYRFLQDTKDVLLKVTKDNLLGVITINGEEILPCKYVQVSEVDLDDDATESIIVAIDINGKKESFAPDGKSRPSFANYSSFGPDGRVYKDGKMGFIDIKTGKLLIPCIYDPNALQGGLQGPDYGGVRRIALGYENYNGATIDIWTLDGKKIASRTFKHNARHLMASFIEEMIGIEVGW